MAVPSKETSSRPAGLRSAFTAVLLLLSSAVAGATQHAATVNYAALIASSPAAECSTVPDDGPAVPSPADGPASPSPAGAGLASGLGPALPNGSPSLFTFSKSAFAYSK